VIQFTLCFRGEVKEMVSSIAHMSRTLSPVEHLILKAVCNGQSNLCISESTHFSVKTVENTISRSARILGVTSTPDINFRVLLTIVYRFNFGEIEAQVNSNDVQGKFALGPAA